MKTHFVFAKWVLEKPISKHHRSENEADSFFGLYDMDELVDEHPVDADIAYESRSH